MKKTICMAGMVLIFVSMVLAGCASMAPVQKTALSPTNLSVLKGTWQGWATFSSFSTTPIMTTVEFKNSTVPLQGTITFTDVPTGAVNAIPNVFTTTGTNVLEFSNGGISDQGTLISGNGTSIVEINYYGGDKPKLEGWFFYKGAKGTVSVSK